MVDKEKFDGIPVHHDKNPTRLAWEEVGEEGRRVVHLYPDTEDVDTQSPFNTPFTNQIVVSADDNHIQPIPHQHIAPYTPGVSSDGDPNKSDSKSQSGTSAIPNPYRDMTSQELKAARIESIRATKAMIAQLREKQVKAERLMQQPRSPLARVLGKLFVRSR